MSQRWIDLPLATVAILAEPEDQNKKSILHARFLKWFLGPHMLIRRLAGAHSPTANCKLARASHRIGPNPELGSAHPAFRLPVAIHTVQRSHPRRQCRPRARG